jgi:excisionase family DNA binding protein
MPQELSLQALGSQLATIPELLREIRAELQAIRLALTREHESGPKGSGKDLLTTAQAAECLGMTEATLATWRSTRRRDVPYVKVGRSVRYRRCDLEAWLEARQWD